MHNKKRRHAHRHLRDARRAADVASAAHVVGNLGVHEKERDGGGLEWVWFRGVCPSCARNTECAEVRDGWFLEPVVRAARGEQARRGGGVCAGWTICLLTPKTEADCPFEAGPDLF